MSLSENYFFVQFRLRCRFIEIDDTNDWGVNDKGTDFPLDVKWYIIA